MAELPQLESLSAMTTVQLKDLLKSYRLTVSGTKAVLIERLTSYIKEQKAAQSDQLAPAKTVPPAKPIEQPLPAKTASASTKTTTKPTNKVAKTEEKIAPEAGTEELEKSTTSVDSKMKRAERFGIQNMETKKAARAERFGIEARDDGITNDTSGDDKKGKRAERFGITAPSGVSEEQQKKISKRKARFGDISSDTTISVNSKPLITETPEIAAKKIKRAERFGLVSA